MLDRVGKFATAAFMLAVAAPGILAAILMGLLEVLVTAGSTYLVAMLLCHVAALPIVLAWIWAAIVACVVLGISFAPFFSNRGLIVDKDPMREALEGVMRAEADAKGLISDYEETFPDASGTGPKAAPVSGWFATMVQEPDRILYRLIWTAWATLWYLVLTTFVLGTTAGGTLILASFANVLDEWTRLPLGRFSAVGIGGLVGIGEVVCLARAYRASLSHSPWE